RASSGLLVQADHISSRITEPRRDLGCVRADWLHDLAPIGYHSVNGRGHAVHQDVKEEPGLSCGRAPEDPRAAHSPGCIVKSSATIAAFADGPAEHSLVELGRARNVRCGHLDVTDLPVRKRSRHRHSLPCAAILAAPKRKLIPYRPRRINIPYAASVSKGRTIRR